MGRRRLRTIHGSRREPEPSPRFRRFWRPLRYLPTPFDGGLFSGLAFDPVGRRAWVSRWFEPVDIVAVDLTTETSRVIAGGDVGNGPTFTEAPSLAVDPTSQRLFFADPAERAVFAIDLETGDSTTLKTARAKLSRRSVKHWPNRPRFGRRPKPPFFAGAPCGWFTGTELSQPLAAQKRGAYRHRSHDRGRTDICNIDTGCGPFFIEVVETVVDDVHRRG